MAKRYTGVKTQNKKYGGKLPWFNRQTLELVMKDRGYFTHRAMVDKLARSLYKQNRNIERMLSTGAFTWEEILVIGHTFEMTAKEFSDTFLSGYFQEDREGHFKCHLDNPDEYVKSKPKTEKSQKTQDLEARQRAIEDELKDYSI